MYVYSDRAKANARPEWVEVLAFALCDWDMRQACWAPTLIEDYYFELSGGTIFASRLRRKRHNDKQAHKAELHEWENEGGNRAPSPEATDTLVPTGSA